MASNSIAAQSTYDFASMAMIKREANGSASQQKSASNKVAAEFEAEFLRLVTSSMQKASEPLKSDLLGSDSLDFFSRYVLFRARTLYRATQIARGRGVHNRCYS